MNRMQIAIMKKDLRGLVSNRQLLPALMVVPLVFTIVLPTIMILTVHFTPNSTEQLKQLMDLLPSKSRSGNIQLQIIGLMLNNIIPMFFMVIPIMVSTIMAASSFVGEKEKRTLETLLYSPLSLKSIFHAKIFASFVLSMIVSFGSFLVMIAVVEAEVFLVTGQMIVPSLNWLVIMFLLSPAVSMMAITLIVRGSAKAQSIEEAQQKAVFLVLPILLLVVGQFTGVLLVNAGLLLILGIIFAIAAILLIKGGIRKFNYELLLK